MCQQWLSVLGLFSDAVGFVLVAIEWHRTFTKDVWMRQYELHRGWVLQQHAEGNTEEEIPPSLEEETQAMAKDFSKFHARDVSTRRRLFFFGVVLVVLGFALQLAGSWPGGAFGTKSC